MLSFKFSSSIRARLFQEKKVKESGVGGVGGGGGDVVSGNHSGEFYFYFYFFSLLFRV